MRWLRWTMMDHGLLPQASSNWGVSTHAVPGYRALVGTLLRLHPLPTSNCLKCPDVTSTFRERWNNWNDWNVDRLIPIILMLYWFAWRVPLRIFRDHSIIIPIAQAPVRFCKGWCFSPVIIGFNSVWIPLPQFIPWVLPCFLQARSSGASSAQVFCEHASMSAKRQRLLECTFDFQSGSIGVLCSIQNALPLLRVEKCRAFHHDCHEMLICQAAIFPSRSFAQRADEFQPKGERQGTKVGNSVCENSRTDENSISSMGSWLHVPSKPKCAIQIY